MHDMGQHPPKRKVLYIITKGNFGGAQRYVFDLATGIPKEQFEVLVAFGEGGILETRLEEAGIRTVHLTSLRRSLGFMSDVHAYLALTFLIRRERPHVVHLNSSKAGILGALATRTANFLNLRRKSRAKIVFTGHGWAFNEDRPLWQRTIIAVAHWITIMLSTATITVSKRTAYQISAFPFIKQKIKTIYNGIDSFPLMSRSESRHLLAPDVHERMWIGTISELHRNKGIDYLLRAFANIAPRHLNTALIIIGEGEERRALEELCRELEIEGRVHFVGFKSEARTLLSALDVLTLTSRTEAFPYILLEAGIAKLPVVASWVGGIPELITHTKTGILIDPENAEQLSSELENLINDSEKRLTLASNLHEKIITSFGINQMIRDTLTLYSAQ